MLLRTPERGLGILEARRGFSRRLPLPHKSEGVPPFDHQALAKQDAVVSDPEHAALFFVPALLVMALQAPLLLVPLLSALAARTPFVAPTLSVLALQVSLFGPETMAKVP